MIGKVISFNNAKGYGFIFVNNRDVFVHYSQILNPDFKTLSPDELVIVGNVVKTDKGFKAQAVEKIQE